MKILSPITVLLLIIAALLLSSSATIANASSNQLLKNLRHHRRNILENDNDFRSLNPNTTIGNVQVDTRIGTAGFGYGCGAINPGPQRPNGAMRIGPDTSLGLEPIKLPFDSEGGYYYGDDYTEGFSHTHVVGGGEAEWQNVLCTVVRAQPTSDVGQPPVSTKTIKNAGYKSKFKHETEIAKPGYYSVLLEEPAIMAEVTATGNMAAMHRYSFGSQQTSSSSSSSSSQNDAVLIIDFAHGSPRTKHLLDFGYSISEVELYKAQMSADHTSANLTLRVLDSGMFVKDAKPLNGINLFFSMQVELDQDSIKAGVTLGDFNFWQNSSFVPSSTSAVNFQNNTSHSAGVAIRLWKSGGIQSGAVLVRTGMSFLGSDFAQANLQIEQYTNNNNAWIDFNDAYMQSQQIWEDLFRRHFINTPDLSTFNNDIGSFYSAVYRVNLAPTDYTECLAPNNCGYYLGLDNIVHQNTNGARRYSDLSTWDTYRSHNSFMILTNPDLARDLANTMIQMSLEAARPPMNNNEAFPQWVMANVETYTMVGIHSTSIALETLLKGVQGINTPELLFDRIVRAVRAQNEEKMPSHGSNGSYSVPGGYGSGAGGTLEFAIDAAAVRNAAIKYFKNTSIAEEMLPFSQAYRNIWNSERMYFCGRFGNGTWDCPPTSEAWLPHPFEKGGFIESSAIQYQWYAPSNYSDLLSLYPSIDFVADRLDKFIAATWLWPFNTTLPSPFLWVGNEPVDGVPFLYNWMGNSYAYRVNDWLDKVYKSFWNYNFFTPSGNDDYGQQSSMIAFFMLGLYPNTPYTTYALFAPKFSHVELRLPGSSTNISVRLLAQNLVSGKTNYLANASVNGRMLPTPFVDHEELVSVAAAGGIPTIEFFCTQTPVTFASTTNTPPWTPPKKDEEMMKAEVFEIAKKVEEKLKGMSDDEIMKKGGKNGKKLRKAKKQLFGM